MPDVSKPTLTHILRAFAPETAHTAALFQESAWAKLQTMASAFPADFAFLMVIEGRLAGQNHQLDLSLSLTPEKASVLAAHLPHGAQHDSIWQRVIAFGQAWKSTLQNHIGHLWLEFDGDATAVEDVPSPSVYFGPLIDAQGVQPWGDGWRDVLGAALPPLLGDIYAPAMLDGVGYFLGHLPSTAYIFEVGLMLPRGRHFIRLCLSGLAKNEMLPYLMACGWPGNPRELGGLLALLASIDELDIYVDIDENGLLPTLGLECRMDGHQEKVMERWRQFLNVLIKYGFCSVEKGRALLHWEAEQAASLAGFAPSQRVLLRLLSHIKMAYRPGQAAEAKAYLTLVHNPI
jgi:hypothetical protein